MAFEIREMLPTPNPNAMKFVLDHPISEQPVSFLTPESGAEHPLASQLFGVKGVTSVLLLGDFVTINKSPATKWPDIKRSVQDILKKI